MPAKVRDTLPLLVKVTEWPAPPLKLSSVPVCPWLMICTPVATDPVVNRRGALLVMLRSYMPSVSSTGEFNVWLPLLPQTRLP
ncbi:hypothetical protein D3C73_872490 [compost metagenome]